MNKKIDIFFLILVILIVGFTRIYFPDYDVFYGDEHKDSLGNFYLSKYDSYMNFADVKNNNIHSSLILIGKILHSIFGYAGIFYFGPGMAVIIAVIFYLVSRAILEPKISFYSTIIFAMHPMVWQSTIKGMFDTNPLILLSLILSIGCSIWIISRKHPLISGLSMGCIAVFLYFTWAGAPLIMFLVLWPIITILSYFNKYGGVTPKYILLFICVGAIVPLVTISNYYGESVSLVSQLQPYNYAMPLDLFLIYAIELYVISRLVKSINDTSKFVPYKNAYVFYGYLTTLSLGLFYMRFYYLVVPFLALSIGMFLDEYGRKFKFTNLLVAVGLTVFMFLSITDVNAPIIVMEDNLKEAIDIVNGLNCSYLMGSWNFGNLYHFYSQKYVLSKSSPLPDYITNSKMWLSQPQTAKQYIMPNSCMVINSNDMASMGARAKYVGINISNESLFKYLNRSDGAGILEFRGHVSMQKLFLLQGPKNLEFWIYENIQ